MVINNLITTRGINPWAWRGGRGSLRPNLWNGLVGCWQTSLGVADKLIDISGHNNHGALINMDTSNWSVSGNPKLPGYALDYNGSNAYVDMGDLAIINAALYGDFTISAWFKTSYRGDTQIIVAKRSSTSPSNGFLVALNTSGLLIGLLDTSSPTGAVLLTSTGAYDDGNWHQALFLRASGILYLYVDKVLEGSTARAGEAASEAEVVIGRRGSGYSAGNQDYFDGQIGDVGFWNRALISEVQDLYQYPNAMFQYMDRGIGKVTVTASIGNTDIQLPLPQLSAFSSPGIADITLPQVVVDLTSLSHSVIALELPVLTVESTSIAVIGDASITLPVLVVNAIGAAGINSASLALHMLTVQGGSGAAGDLTLPIITIDGLSTNHADASLTLPLPALSATNVAPATATLALPLLTIYGAGTAGGNTVSLSLPILTVTSSAISLHGDVSLSLPILTMASTGSVVFIANASLTLPIPVLSATNVAPATSLVALPVLTLVASAISLHGDVSLSLPVLVVSSTSTVASTGDASVALPVLIVGSSSGLGGGIVLPLLSLIARTYNGLAPECVVMNTKNFAVSEYINYGFNSMARFNGANLIADQNGIYEEDGSDTDHAGTDDYPIKAHVKSGRIDLFKGAINKLRNGWVNYQGDGDIRIVTRSDKKETRCYDLPFHSTTEGINERRIKFQKGLKNRYVDFKTQNILGSQLEIDRITITLEPVVSKRR